MLNRSIDRRGVNLLKRSHVVYVHVKLNHFRENLNKMRLFFAVDRYYRIQISTVSNRIDLFCLLGYLSKELRDFHGATSQSELFLGRFKVYSTRLQSAKLTPTVKSRYIHPPRQTKIGLKTRPVREFGCKIKTFD